MLKDKNSSWNNLALMLSDQSPWYFEIRHEGQLLDTIQGPLALKIDDVTRKVASLCRSTERNGLIPALELNEIVLKAIEHRSYCDPSPVVLDIRPYSITVESPGGLLRTGGSYRERTRNPLLAEVVSSLGLKNPKIRGIAGVMNSFRGS